MMTPELAEDYTKWVEYLQTQMLTEKDKKDYSEEYIEGFNRAITGIIFLFRGYISGRYKRE